MAVWNDDRIQDWARFNVEPYTPARVSAYSLNLTLGNEVRKPRSRLSRVWRRFDNWLHGRTFEKEKDRETDLRWHPRQEFTKLTIKRGDFFILHSAEYIDMPHNCVGLLFLNSTEARNGHEQAHAGFFESEFEGQAVWEATHNHPQPITFWAGDRFGQMVFFETVAPALIGYDKTGRYMKQRGAQVAK